MGHADVAVLDGGTAAWREAGGAMTAEVTTPRAAAPYPALPAAMPTIDADALLARLGRVQIVDARAGERFRGEVEPLDTAAGHIPGARNRLFKDNLAADGRFKSPATLRAEWLPLLGRQRGRPDRAAVRVGRHRLPQPAGHGPRRPRRQRAVPGLVERMVGRPGTAAGARLSTSKPPGWPASGKARVPS